MISYWLDPVAVDEVNMSYETSATRLVPVYVQSKVDCIDVRAESFFGVNLTTAFGYDLTLLAPPAQDQL